MYSFIKNNFFLSHNQKTLNNYKKLLAEVNQKEKIIKQLSDNELLHKTKLLKQRFSKGETLNDL